MSNRACLEDRRPGGIISASALSLEATQRATERVGVVIVERASSRDGILLQLRTQSALRRSIRHSSLEGSMEGTFVNDSKLDKHVFCHVNSKKSTLELQKSHC